MLWLWSKKIINGPVTTTHGAIAPRGRAAVIADNRRLSALRLSATLRLSGTVLSRRVAAPQCWLATNFFISISNFRFLFITLYKVHFYASLMWKSTERSESAQLTSSQTNPNIEVISHCSERVRATEREWVEQKRTHMAGAIYESTRWDLTKIFSTFLSGIVDSTQCCVGALQHCHDRVSNFFYSQHSNSKHALKNGNRSAMCILFFYLKLQINFF